MALSNIPRVRKAVFPVAGLGTRLLPATKVMPKEMLPVVDRPLIQIAVEEAQEAGIDEFIFVTSHGKEMLVEHFEDAPELVDVLRNRGKLDQIAKVNAVTLPDRALATALQNKPLGLGHAVWCAQQLVGDEPFAVLLPDDIIRGPRGCLAQMMDVYHRQGGNVIAVCEVAKADTSKYGILDIAGQDGNVVKVKGLVEKPSPDHAPSNMAIIGRYILQPGLFTHLARHERGAGGEIQLTDAMARLLADEPFFGVLFEGERLDCGTDKGFVMAQIAYALDQPALADAVAAYMEQKLQVYRDKAETLASRRVANG